MTPLARVQLSPYVLTTFVSPLFGLIYTVQVCTPVTECETSGRGTPGAHAQRALDFVEIEAHRIYGITAGGARSGLPQLLTSPTSPVSSVVYLMAESSREKIILPRGGAQYHCTCVATSPLKCGDEDVCRCKDNGVKCTSNCMCHRDKTGKMLKTVRCKNV